MNMRILISILLSLSVSYHSLYAIPTYLSLSIRPLFAWFAGPRINRPLPEQPIQTPGFGVEIVPRSEESERLRRENADLRAQILEHRATEDRLHRELEQFQNRYADQTRQLLMEGEMRRAQQSEVADTIRRAQTSEDRALMFEMEASETEVRRQKWEDLTDEQVEFIREQSDFLMQLLSNKKEEKVKLDTCGARLKEIQDQLERFNASAEDEARGLSGFCDVTKSILADTNVILQYIMDANARPNEGTREAIRHFATERRATLEEHLKASLALSDNLRLMKERNAAQLQLIKKIIVHILETVQLNPVAKDSDKGKEKEKEG